MSTAHAPAPLQCFNEPRLLNQPCGIVTVGGQQRTFDCDFDAGLTCDISVGRCVAAAKEVRGNRCSLCLQVVLLDMGD